MTNRPGIRDFLWMASGAVVLLVLTLTVLHFHKEENPAEQVAFKATRIELVDRMRVALASASEAEKSAVLAITDEDSKTFADQAAPPVRCGTRAAGFGRASTEGWHRERARPPRAVFARVSSTFGASTTSC